MGRTPKLPGLGAQNSPENHPRRPWLFHGGPQMVGSMTPPALIGEYHSHHCPVSMNIHNYQNYLFFNEEKIDLNDVIAVHGAPTARLRRVGASAKLLQIVLSLLSSSTAREALSEIPSTWEIDFFIRVLDGCPRETCSRLKISFENGR